MAMTKLPKNPGKKEPKTIVNSQGNSVLYKDISKYDRERDRVARRIFSMMKKLQEEMAKKKGIIIRLIDEFDTFTRVECGLTSKGKKGNLSFYSYDQQIKIERKNQNFIAFGNKLKPAVELIRECLKIWSDGIGSPLRIMVENLLTPDESGNMSISGILSMIKLPMPKNDPAYETWEKAMSIIKESMEVIYSKLYFRAFLRNTEENKFEPLSLDFASIDPVIPTKKTKEKKSIGGN